MSLPYNALTPFLGDNATEYIPEYETSLEFMNGKFAELLANDKDLDNKINVLNGNLNGFKIYSNISEIVQTPKNTEEVLKAMSDKTILLHGVGKSQITDLPCSYGQIEIIRITSNYMRCIVEETGTGNMYSCTYHTSSSKFSGWKQIATKETIVNIWEGSVVNGDITLSESVTGFYKIDICTQPASGYGYTPYTLDRGMYFIQSNAKYAIPIGSGKGLDIVFSTDGLTATVSNNTGILRRIVGYKGGR